MIYSDKTMASCLKKLKKCTERRVGLCRVACAPTICSMRGLNPRPMAHRTIALTTELMEPCRRGPEHISIILAFSWRGSFVRWKQSADIKTYRGAVGYGFSGLSGDLATQNALPGSFSVVKDGL